MMGMKNSPYACIKGLLLALESIQGDHKDASNPFHFDTVSLNLPGDPEYDPRQPRLQRLVNSSGKRAAMIVSYVDDMRAAGSTTKECWVIMHAVGSMVSTDVHGVAVRATQEKWEKIKMQVRQILEQVEAGQPLERKFLESVRGSLVYLHRTYPALTPYVKGFHLSIDAWRPDRDADGWRILTTTSIDTPSIAPSDAPPKDPATNTSNMPLVPPPFVTPVPRLKNDLLSLLALFSSPSPPLRYIRSMNIMETKYGFADASRAGFGASFSEGEDIHYTHGIWADEANCSSNFRELANLVESLEAGWQSGRLKHSKVWIFTDNSASEAIFWKGHSPKMKLNDLALRLRRLEMQGDIRIHMVHVPGTRMISQGTDGLSWGDLTEGVMAGKPMLQYIPLRLSDRH
jgi:hypothetical protein